MKRIFALLVVLGALAACNPPQVRAFYRSGDTFYLQTHLDKTYMCELTEDTLDCKKALSVQLDADYWKKDGYFAK